MLTQPDWPHSLDALVDVDEHSQSFLHQLSSPRMAARLFPLAGTMSHRLYRPAIHLAAALFLVVLIAESRVSAEQDQPLHQQIDALLGQSRFGPLANVTDDATFLRRVTLDLAGRIPTNEEVRQFLADDSAEKRRRVVDRLLGSRESDRQLAVVFDLILMERRGGKHVKTEEFRQYLEESFAAGKSYLNIVREILAADGSPEKNRAAAAFYLERELTPDLLTRDIGRIFFGIDVQCAQCHNHPNIDDYHQEDYYGLQAFVIRASLHQPDKKQPALIAEKAEGEAAFQSVFTDRSSMTGPRLPGGTELVSVVLKPGDRYVVSPAKDVRHVPKVSRLQSLAETAFSQPTEQFNRNLANRLWGHMFGQGLVHPPDLHHSGNAPSHPELLALLSEAVQAADYNVKAILREIALSRVYQLGEQVEPVPLSREQLEQDIAALESQATAESQKAGDADREVDTAVEILDAAVAELKPLREAIGAVEKQIVELIKKRDEAAKKLEAGQAAVLDQESKITLVQQAFEKTELAAKAIEKDPELSAAVGSLSAKLKSLQEQLPKLQESAAATAGQLKEFEVQLTAANTSADQAIAAARPQEEKVKGLRDALLVIRRRAAEHRSLAATAIRKQEQLTTLLESLKLSEQLAQLNAAIPQQAAELEAANAGIPKLEAALKAAEQVQKTAGETVAQAQQVLEQRTTQHAELQLTHGLLLASLGKLDEASKRLEEDAALGVARTQIAAAVEAAQGRVSASATQVAEQQTLLKTKQDMLTVAQNTTQAAATALKQQQTQVQQLSSRLRESRETLAVTQGQAEHVQAQVQRQAAARLNAVALAPLSPEQLGMSMLVATGQLLRIRAGEVAKLDKESPLPEADQQNPEKIAARQQTVEAATAQAAFKTINPFIQLFGAGAGQPQDEFFATADQALFLANGGELRSWLTPGGGNLTDRLVKLDTPEAVAEELYLSLFSRLPTASEVAFVKKSLEQLQDNKGLAVQELAWGLMTSAEFRFRY